MDRYRSKPRPHGPRTWLTALVPALLFLGLPLSALEDLDRIQTQFGSALISIQQDTLMGIFSPLKEGGYLRTETRSRSSQEGNTIMVRSESPGAITTYRFEASGILLEYENRVIPDPETERNKARLASQGGPPGNRVYTRIVRLADGNYRQVSREKDGSQDQKDFSLTGKDVLFFQLPYLVQKAVKAGNSAGFNFDGVFGPGFKQNFDLRIIRNTSPQGAAGQYRYPAEVSKAFQNLDIQTVAELSLTGLAGLVYPHKIYFGFGKQPDFYLRAFWGGEPGKDFFQIEQVP